MKNILLFSLLLLHFAAFSQEKTEVPRPRVRFSMEVMGGLTLSNMPIHFERPFYDNNEPDYDTRAGFYAGLAGRVQFTSRWAVRLEGQYAQKGYRGESFGIKFHHRSSYVDVIPQVEYKIIPHLWVSLGGYAGFRTAEQFKLGNDDWKNYFGGPWQSTEDFGLVAGLTGNFGRFRAYVRYQYGLYDIDENIYTNEIGELLFSTQYNRSIQLGVGYRLL